MSCWYPTNTIQLLWTQDDGCDVRSPIQTVRDSPIAAEILPLTTLVTACSLAQKSDIATPNKSIYVHNFECKRTVCRPNFFQKCSSYLCLF